MACTEHDRAAGSAVRSDLGTATLHTLSVGPMDNNTYLLICRATGLSLLVDAAAEPDRLLALLDKETGGSLDLVVTTHRHADHRGALTQVLATTGARHACGGADAEAIGVPTDRLLAHGDVVEVGALRLEIIALRGHTPGSVALAWREPQGADGDPGRVHLFTGDSLFPGGPGRTAGPAEFASLMADLEARVFGVLDDATLVHPGHGAGTTLGVERPALPAWRARGW